MYTNPSKNRWRQILRSNINHDESIKLNTQIRANKYGRKTVRLLLESKKLNVEQGFNLNRKEQVETILVCFRFLSSVEKERAFFTNKHMTITKGLYNYLLGNKRKTDHFNMLLMVDLEKIAIKILDTDDELDNYETSLLKAICKM